MGIYKDWQIHTKTGHQIAREPVFILMEHHIIIFGTDRVTSYKIDNIDNDKEFDGQT